MKNKMEQNLYQFQCQSSKFGKLKYKFLRSTYRKSSGNHNYVSASNRQLSYALLGCIINLFFKSEYKSLMDNVIKDDKVTIKSLE